MTGSVERSCLDKNLRSTLRSLPERLITDRGSGIAQRMWRIDKNVDVSPLAPNLGASRPPKPSPEPRSVTVSEAASWHNFNSEMFDELLIRHLADVIHNKYM